jgi:hypothetical protein
LLVEVLLTEFSMDSGPQLMLIQLLPSSTVAVGVKLKTGLGTIASAMPGGTCQPQPVTPPAQASGGIREPLQYWLTTTGLLPELVVLYPEVLVNTPNNGFRV